MEDPKTPETLKSQSPSEDISGFSGLADLSGGLTVEIQVAENGVAVSACSNEEAEIGNVEWRNEEDMKGMDGFEGEVLDGSVVFVAGAEEDGGNGGGVEDEQNERSAVEFDGGSIAKDMEAYGDGISLTVDFLNIQLEESELSKSIGMEEMLEVAQDEMQVIENGNEHNFSVGDVVWVKTKSQTWWPGKIYPSDAAESDESNRHGSLLVGYLGSSHRTWCSPSQLIPFAENFEQMSGKYKSRSFLGAVEKAVDEFGRCVRLEMICSCIPEGDRPEADDGSKDANSLPRRKSGFLAKYSVDQYETETFLARVKDLAQIVSRCGTLESSILYNQLAAFQSSIGHLQLPLHQLFETHDAEDNVVGRSVRKSKARVTVKNEEEQGKGGTEGSPSDLLSVESDVQREKIEEMNGDPNKILDESKDGGKRSCRRKTIANGGIESRSAKRKRSEKFEDLETIKILAFEGKDFGVGDYDDENKEMSEKRSETRERKKSKYLSFPYINWRPKGMSAETEDINKALKIFGEDKNENEVEGENETPLLSKCSGKFWKKWYRNITSGSDVSDNQELMMSALPAEFLSELHFTAVNCFYPNENSNFDAVAQFFSRFRIFMFHDESDNAGQNEAMAADLFYLGGKVSEVKHPSSSAKSGSRKRKGLASSNTKTEEMASKLISNDADLTGKAEICPAGDAQKKTPLSCNIKSKKDGQSLGRLKTKSLSSLSDVNVSISSSSPLTKDSPEIGPGPLTPNGVPKRRKRRNGGSHPQSKPTAEIPDLNGSGSVPGLLVEDQQAVSQVASQQKSEPKKRRKLGVTKEHSKVSTEFIDVNNISKPGSFFIDIQVTAQQPGSVIPEKNMLNFAGSPNLSVKEQKIAQDKSKSGVKRRKRKEKPPLADSKVILSSDIPDLNGMGIESGQGKDSQLTNSLPQPTKPKRRRKKKGEAGLNHPNPSDRPYIYNKVKTDGEGLGSLLLLTFSSEAPLPPREQVITTFSQFGSLKESEIQLKDSTVEIVFLRSADAKEAIRSLKKNNIFGPTLLKYQLYHLSAPPKMSDSDRACTALAYPASEGTLNPSKSAELGAPAGEAPPIEFIRRNLQMMTSMLEKSGDNLSPDMRAKLESDVECLLKKVSSMAGSSLT